MVLHLRIHVLTENNYMLNQDWYRKKLRKLSLMCGVQLYFVVHVSKIQVHVRDHIIGPSYDRIS